MNTNRNIDEDPHDPSGREVLHSSALLKGHRIHVTDRPGIEPAIIMLHGFPDNSHLWDAVIPQMPDRRLVTFDFLGWGRSDKPRDYDYTFEGQVEEISAVVKHLGLHRVELVGHDSSLSAALDWTLDHADRVAAVTLMNGFYLSADGVRPPAAISLLIFGQMDPTLRFGMLPAGITGGMNSLGKAFESNEALMEVVMTWQQRLFFARAGDASHFTPLFLRQFKGPANSVGPLRSLTAKTFRNVAMHASRMDELKTLTVPVSCVWGGKDEDLKVAAAHTILRLVPKGRLKVFEDAHHNVQIDEAPGVARLLLEASSF